MSIPLDQLVRDVSEQSDSRAANIIAHYVTGQTIYSRAEVEFSITRILPDRAVTLHRMLGDEIERRLDDKIKGAELMINAGNKAYAETVAFMRKYGVRTSF